MSKFFTMTFARVYPLYVAKVERKGRTVEELDPGKAGKLSPGRKFLGIIPFGNSMKRY